MTDPAGANTYTMFTSGTGSYVTGICSSIKVWVIGGGGGAASTTAADSTAGGGGGAGGVAYKIWS